MFKQTLRKLTMLFSLVFLVLFVFFTSTLYGYISSRLFVKVDEAIAEQANAFKTPRHSSQRVRRMFDPRIFLLLRGVDDSVVNLAAFRDDDRRYLADLVADSKVGEPTIKEYEGHFYRIICVPADVSPPHFAIEVPIKEIVAVSIVDSEINLLHQLLLIIIGGLVMGTAVIIMTSYYLAKRAMVPIEAAWHRQQQFVADASHELRSPLTGIYSNAELLLRHPENTILQEQRRIQTIMQECSRMTKLTAGLLTLARSDAGQTALQLAPVNISELIGIIAEHFYTVVAKKQITLTVDTAAELWLNGDQEKLHQLLVILIDNAFKYTPLGGSITISVGLLDKQIRINVTDTGCGIAPENVKRIFDRFFREDKARSRDSGGIGLGLSIAKEIVELHGGKIKVNSQPGLGTSFQITLPAGNVKK